LVDEYDYIARKIVNNESYIISEKLEEAVEKKINNDFIIELRTFNPFKNYKYT